MTKCYFTKRLKLACWTAILRLTYCLLFFMTFQMHIYAADTLKLVNLRTIGDDARTRIIAVFNAKPNFSLQILDAPARLVINLPTVDLSVQNTLSGKQRALSAMLSDIHYSAPGAQASHITLTSKTAFSIEKNAVQKLNNGLWQILIDITQNTQKKFIQTLEKQRENGQNAKAQLDLAHPFRVVLDPGHGGVDSGAQGVTGILEKNITLAFVRALRSELEKDPNIEVILTRDSDVFLKLNERVKKAQKANADLFMSIHADTINLQYLRGATVYTLSDKASDVIAKTLAENENMMDLFEGLPLQESSEVANILIDLAQRETHTFSVNFADRIILNLSKNNINLINNPHRYAAFQVLKAPDIPSVLIEIGYLSNKEDEKSLNNPQWREQVAASIADSVRQFAEYRREITQSF
ncbi:N-acetylmuramoyl-L-alanine amidase [Bartonella australis AUST/NH1]|uniref:N-acetylmuramoyl-L-alanine amidase n=1 Tax=Bartonella australis (strain Aust/NH1) TaxID=1094489 RepID=M1NTB4_BARAA|nr:N-acetylmuramoyl-L-alanine amidase [Bartonella australis]AGF74548.1 N-acetylmuramoyl-L-alanine amidase [Bartonella australis AUST/NH1]